MIIGIIADFILGTITMIIAATLLLVSVKLSRFASQASTLILCGMGLSTISLLLDLSFLRGTGHIILFTGLFIGCLGLRYRIKSNAPFLVFTLAFLVEQILSYALNINLLKLLTAVNKYNFYPFTSVILPVILTMLVSRKLLRKQRSLNTGSIK